MKLISCGQRRPFSFGCLVLVLMASLSASSADTATSGSAFMHVNTYSNSLWRTASSNVLLLPVEYPAGAVSARLTVVGIGYSRIYDDVSEGLFELTLPAASAANKENVYTLTLSFNEGEPRVAKIGVIYGVAAAAEGTTRFVSEERPNRWRRSAGGPVVLPIPHDTETLTVDGEVVDTGLDGAQGWHALPEITDEAGHEMEIETDEGSFFARIWAAAGGLLLLLR